MPELLKEKIEIRSFFIRDINGMFKVIPMRLSDLIVTTLLEWSEKIEFIFSKEIPKKLLVVIETINRTSWLELEIYKRTWGLSVFAKPKTTNVKKRRLDHRIDKNMLFSLLIPNGSKTVLITGQYAYGDCEVLDFFI